MWVEAISKRTKVPEDALWRLARSASKRYYEFTIDKADGTARLIQHPSRPLKALQRIINRSLVSAAPVHEAATAYAKGSKILKNAERHLGTEYTTRLDFADFFPSFDADSVTQFFRRLSQMNNLGLADSDIDFVTKIVCRHNRLVIGAPSSPKITNAMMYDFDSAATEIANNYGIVFTRYADDMFISSYEKGVLSAAEADLRILVEAHNCPKLTLKEAKTLHLSRAGHRSITGLIITSEGSISLGRDRKREIRTLVYLGLSHKLSNTQRQYLTGLLSFALDNEPDFVGSLSRKFEMDIIAWFKGGCT
tara:strand:- start:537 stop:1457 length:921 start_codon:yes stop_codon:yes gene_type:complete